MILSKAVAGAVAVRLQPYAIAILFSVSFVASCQHGRVKKNLGIWKPMISVRPSKGATRRQVLAGRVALAAAGAAAAAAP
jgi:hypothetical protein